MLGGGGEVTSGSWVEFSEQLRLQSFRVLGFNSLQPCICLKGCHEMCSSSAATALKTRA